MTPVLGSVTFSSKEDFRFLWGWAREVKGTNEQVFGGSRCRKGIRNDGPALVGVGLRDGNRHVQTRLVLIDRLIEIRGTESGIPLLKRD